MHVSSNRPVSEDEEEDECILPAVLIIKGRRWIVTSMDCRRPTGGVYVSSDTSHAEGVHHSDP